MGGDGGETKECTLDVLNTDREGCTLSNMGSSHVRPLCSSLTSSKDCQKELMNEPPLC